MVDSILAGFGITAASIAAPLEAKRERFLAKYGWTPQIMADYGIVLRNGTILDKKVGWHPSYAWALQGYKGGPIHDYADIPFYDIAGEPLMVFHTAGGYLPYRRARLLDYYDPSGGSGKYKSYKGSGVCLYLPHNQGRPDYWVDLAHDPTRAIVITEGELDAISGHARGLPCMAVAGVSMFLEKKKTSQVVARPGDQIIWQSRDVYICFDQDEESTGEAPWKASIVPAGQKLAMALTLLGARVKLMNLSKTTVGLEHTGEKMGLSEYYAWGGKTKELWTCTEPLDFGTGDLIYLLDRYANYRGKVLDCETGIVYSRTDFANDYSNAFAPDPNDGAKLKRATDLWAISRLRKNVIKFVFDPEREPGYCDNLDGTGFFNQWHGFAIEPGSWEVGPGKEAVEWFEELGERMWGGRWDWVRGMMAHLFQKPGAKRNHALILQSPVQGIGKSAFFQLIGTIIGWAVDDVGGHAIETDPKKFFADFNTLMGGRLLVLFDEAHIRRGQLAEDLKKQITAMSLTVQPKGVDSFLVPWKGIFALTTNKDFAVFMEDGARRYFQSTPSVSEAEKPEWQAWLRPVLERLLGPQDREETAEELGERMVRLSGIRAWLMQEDWLSDYNPMADAPSSDSRTLATAASKSSSDWKTDRLWESLPEIFVMTPGNREAYGNEDIGAYGFTQACARAPYKASAVIRADGKTVRVTIYSKGRQLPTKLDAQGSLVFDPRAVAEGGAEFIRKWLALTDTCLRDFRPGSVLDLGKIDFED
ncbi:MAG: DUF3854 domain-containing protein [Desulfurellales bacterium]|nr:MAG: DUF3854 domain-containing protein [Desulfurellales bacterium]